MVMKQLKNFYYWLRRGYGPRLAWRLARVTLRRGKPC